MCGVEGEAGDQPGEGKIVHCGGESFGGRIPAHGSVCDDCADGARTANMSLDRTLLTVGQVWERLEESGTPAAAFWSIAGGQQTPLLAADYDWIADAADRSVRS